MKKLKIAAMISGEPRFTEDFDVFLDKTANYTIDWYIMLWQTSGDVSNSHFKHSLVPNFWKNINYEKSYERLSNFLPTTHNLAKLELLDQTQFQLDWEVKLTDKNVRPNSCWLMFQGLKQVNNLLPDATNEYDLVIRTRPDLSIDREINLYEIYEFLKKSPKTVIMPKNFWFGHGPIANDIFAIATPEVMKIYCDVVSSIPKFQAEGKIFHPETMLAMHLENHGIHLKRHDFEAELRYINATEDRFPSFGRWN